MNKVREKITTAQLTAVLQDIKGAKIATIVTETTPELKKKGNPYENVTKRMTSNVTMNFNYRNALEKAGKAVSKAVKAGKRAWGERVPNSPFIMHEGALYFEVKMNGKPSSIEYLVKDGLVKGVNVVLSNDKIAPFLPVRVAPLVPMMAVKIQNVKELRVNGKCYVIA